MVKLIHDAWGILVTISRVEGDTRTESIKPRSDFPDASVDPTDARCAKWLRAAEHGSTIARRTGLRRAGPLPRYARPSSRLTPGFAGPSTERSTPRDSARPPANPNSLGFLTDSVRRPWLAGGGPEQLGSRSATPPLSDRPVAACHDANVRQERASVRAAILGAAMPLFESRLPSESGREASKDSA